MIPLCCQEDKGRRRRNPNRSEKGEDGEKNGLCALQSEGAPRIKISERRPECRATVWTPKKMAFVERRKLVMKKNSKMKKLLSLLMTCLVVMSLGVSAFAAGTAEIADGVTVLKEGATDVTYNVGEGKVIALVGSADEQNPVVFKDCTFNLSGKTMSPGRVDGLTYAVGETYTKLLMGGNIRFENCTFVSENGVRSSTGGNDVCMYIGSGNIVFDGSEIKGADYVGQFFGLFYDANVTLNNSTIATTGNTGGWSYAMYGTSVLNLNGSTMTATGMKRLGGRRKRQRFLFREICAPTMTQSTSRTPPLISAIIMVAALPSTASISMWIIRQLRSTTMRATLQTPAYGM